MLDDWLKHPRRGYKRNKKDVDRKTGEMIKARKLGYWKNLPLNSAKMELLDGIPTVIGGYDTDIGKQNRYLYQYFEKYDAWQRHPTITLRIARSSPAVFPVPSNLFNCY